ncbi:MAG: metalloregulator ArsR/SmtB family transcription factor [Halanaerobiales bacterium]|nr:metalloregulator ArsR/SmtB family transcription factor [Halanaerobiales bacterium]
MIYILKALGHENRLRLLNLLKQKKFCVCELRNIMDINQSNASRHLAKLKAAGLVDFEKNEQWVYYFINQDIFLKFPFLEKLIKDELKKLKICQIDEKKALIYADSQVSCEELDESNIFTKQNIGGN